MAHGLQRPRTELCPASGSHGDSRLERGGNGGGKQLRRNAPFLSPRRRGAALGADGRPQAGNPPAGKRELRRDTLQPLVRRLRLGGFPGAGPFGDVGSLRSEGGDENRHAHHRVAAREDSRRRDAGLRRGAGKVPAAPRTRPADPQDGSEAERERPAKRAAGAVRIARDAAVHAAAQRAGSETGGQEFALGNPAFEPGSLTDGALTGTLNTFGAEEGTLHAIEVEVLLVDGKTIVKQTMTDISFKEETDGEGNIVIRLEADIPEPLPDVKPEGGSGSGFDADVDDWDEEHTQEVPV